MNRQRPRTLVIYLTCLFIGQAPLAAIGGAPQAGKCTAHPCPNTPSGEDPGVIEAREGKKLEDELRSDPDDQTRWESLILFSSSSDKQQLTIPIVMAEKFNVALDPKNGWLTFSSPRFSQSFKISSPLPASGSTCPKYQIRVLDGGTDYALIKRTCPKYEYREQRFYRGADYYLYDGKTNTMRGIWAASTMLDTSGPFPSAKPEVSLKKIKNGYQFDWVGKVPSDNPPTQMKIHNLYKREPNGKGGYALVCYDATNPTHLIKENEMCESEILERVVK
jgi:hypothetical protein